MAKVNRFYRSEPECFSQKSIYLLPEENGESSLILLPNISLDKYIKYTKQTIENAKHNSAK